MRRGGEVLQAGVGESPNGMHADADDLDVVGSYHGPSVEPAAYLERSILP